MCAARTIRRRRGGLLAAGFAAAVVGLLSPVASATAAGEVKVWDTSGKRAVPCPAIDDSDLRALRGGCLVEMDSREIDIVVRSVVGDMVFATCEYWHDLRVDGSGRTYLESIESGGPYPCNDLNACNHKDIKPWQGRIVAGANGRMTHVVDACFDTCMGQFTGELRLGLKRVGDRWEQTADLALTGDSGYRLDGSWYTEERNLIDIRPADGSAGGSDGDGPDGSESVDGGSAGGHVAGVWRLTGEPVGWPI